MFSEMHEAMDKVLEVYSEIRPLQEQINELIEKAREQFKTLTPEQQEEQKAYLQCAESYETNF